MSDDDFRREAAAEILERLSPPWYVIRVGMDLDDDPDDDDPITDNWDRAKLEVFCRIGPNLDSSCSDCREAAADALLSLCSAQAPGPWEAEVDGHIYRIEPVSVFALKPEVGDE